MFFGSEWKSEMRMIRKIGFFACHVIWHRLMYFEYSVKIFVVIVCSIMFFVQTSSAQFVDVANKSSIVLDGIEGLYGNGISLYDFNQDGLDDLTFCSKNGGVRTFVSDGQSFTELNVIPYIEGDIKQVMWVDYDNDDDPDFFCSIYGASCMLFRNDNELGLVNVTDSLNLPITTGKSFGAAWADFDRDGFLDVYVCNYDFILPAATSNWFFRNNGDGGFEEIANVFGCDNGMRASFQPAWIDINFDLYPDLFVINDKYHGNAFYKNNDGVFDDVSALFHLNHQMESMSNSWSDFDNDLDFDVYVSNTVQGNILMRNEGDLFVDIASDAGVDIGSVCWSALWIDYDHNGKDDLHVSTNSPAFNGNQNYLFRSETDSTFYPDIIQGDNAPVIASAMGDINADGYIDFVEMKQYPLGIKIYRNNGGENHWLKVSLKGTASNHDGVGTLIRYYVQGEEKIRATFCGENFLSQNSQYEILSLNDALSVDSLFIEWPSGWVDKFFDIQGDQFFEITEGSTFDVRIVNFSDGSLCPGDSIVLIAESTGTILWTDGSVQNELIVTSPGVYDVGATNDFGWTANASIVISEFVMPQLDWQSVHPSCTDSSNGAIYMIYIPEEIQSIQWVGFEATDSLVNLPEGIYEFIVSDYNGCFQTGEIELIQPLMLSLFIANDTICPGMFADLEFMLHGGTGVASMQWLELNPDSIAAGNYQLTAQDENNCIATSDFFIEEFPLLHCDQTILNPTLQSGGAIELDVSGGLPPYTFLWNDGSVNSVLENLSEGFYSCAIEDAAGCDLFVSTELLLNNINEIKAVDLIGASFFDTELRMRVSQPTQIFIYELSGKLRFSEMVVPSDFCINTSSWNEGVYFLKTKNSTMRLVKLHR